jgi:hypothetical protein
MLIRCANPNCHIPRKSYSEGRLFQFEIVAISVAASDDTCEPFDEKPERKISHFWLCESCAAKMSLELDPKQGLRLVPLRENQVHQLPQAEHTRAQSRKHC